MQLMVDFTDLWPHLMQSAVISVLEAGHLYRTVHRQSEATLDGTCAIVFRDISESKSDRQTTVRNCVRVELKIQRMRWDTIWVNSIQMVLSWIWLLLSGQIYCHVPPTASTMSTLSHPLRKKCDIFGNSDFLWNDFSIPREILIREEIYYKLSLYHNIN